jgi:hypothetical protein
VREAEEKVRREAPGTWDLGTSKSHTGGGE